MKPQGKDPSFFDEVKSLQELDAEANSSATSKNKSSDNCSISEFPQLPPRAFESQSREPSFNDEVKSLKELDAEVVGEQNNAYIEVPLKILSMTLKPNTSCQKSTYENVKVSRSRRSVSVSVARKKKKKSSSMVTDVLMRSQSVINISYWDQNQIETSKKTEVGNGNELLTKYRPIIVDGCNIAYEHGKKNGMKKCYSAKGLLIVYNYFTEKFGYTSDNFWIVNKQYRKRSRENQDILDHLDKIDVLINTPRRQVGENVIACDDDLFMLNCAKDKGGIVVSRDQFKDAYDRTTDLKLKDVIENRVLQYVFKGDEIMFPDDPLGARGPTLQQFLRF